MSALLEARGLTRMFGHVTALDGADFAPCVSPVDVSGLAEGCELCAVVKANAYGHGSERVAIALEEAGAEIGQSKSWASRLHARAIERLKELLDDEEAPASSDDTRRQSHGGSDGRRLGSANRPAEAAGSGRSAGK